MQTFERLSGQHTPAQIRVRGLAKIYQRGAEPVQALAGIDLDIVAGSFVAIMGQSGSGKTTLLNVLTGVDRPSTGEVWLGSHRLDTLSESRMAILRRRHIGLIFQAFNLLNNMSALENVMLPALLAGDSSRVARNRAIVVLDTLGLSAHAHKLPGHLSGGQQQRVAIGRALINNPDVLYADEPTGNLDAQTGQKVLQLLKSLHARGQTIVLVTHDAQIASQAQRIIVMRDGRIVDDTTGATRRPVPPSLLADMSSLHIDD